ncbi:MAG: glycosyltransferase [Lachnospiraceae bacterium]|jgi:glycosyltransferase involved in cell wall biosynthesis|nr:glycosyltransferase [Lachnospiraceae bacterium]
MEKMPLISVIVPVYNASGYLEECVRSIQGQSYENLEIILVDDGSTDGSGKICDEFAEEDQRIRIIHQENMGAAGARKNGILCAAGEYICFVDADDQIDAGMMEFFRKSMGECDLLTSGCRCEIAPGEYEIWTDSLGEGLYDTDKARKYFIENMIAYENRFRAGVQPYLWGKLYRRTVVWEAIQHIDTSIVYSEDRDLLYRCILKSKSIRISYKCFYYYRYNPSSIIRTVNKNFMSDLNRLYLSLEKAFSGHPQEECLLNQLQQFLVSRMYLIPFFMGFSSDAQIAGYVFPFSELETGSRIVLYGAGKVGMRYYQQIYRQNQLQMVLWVDKNWRDYEESSWPVSSPEWIGEEEYDYVVIAVKREALAMEIQKELVEIGIRENQILWREPAIF